MTLADPPGIEDFLSENVYGIQKEKAQTLTDVPVRICAFYEQSVGSYWITSPLKVRTTVPSAVLAFTVVVLVKGPTLAAL
jgi:hypothetical protein